MRLEPDNLERRISRCSSDPIPEERQFRWAKQIASAASWLESLVYYHGDLRPENILLSQNEHAKICDFGRAQKRGCRVDVATYPYYRPPAKKAVAVAGPEHEQFAIGSCIYTIRIGEIPYGEWGTFEEFQGICDALVRGEFPSTEGDEVLGRVVMGCWRGEYGSMGDVEAAIEKAVGGLEEDGGGGGGGNACLSEEEYQACVRKCREFLAQQGGLGGT